MDRQFIVYDNSTARIDARQLHYRDLNQCLRQAVAAGAQRITVHNVYGQRYIGTNLPGPVQIEIHGTPGNDLGAFMDGPRIIVHGNVQDGCGNTMNGGEIIVHGRAGDIVGYSMRGGKIFVRDGAGYRLGIHMKEYEGRKPAIVIGGTVQHFPGEYMAGGVLVVLKLDVDDDERHPASFIGTGMHGGVMYIQGELADHQLGREVGRVAEGDDADWATLAELVEQFASHFGYDAEEILSRHFTKLIPLSIRPYGRLYAY
jgi:glutamate synthase domain-containing protein 3